MTSMISQNEQKENQFSTTVDNFFKTKKRRDGSIASF